MQTLRHSQRVAALALLLGGCATWISARGDASGPVAISAPTSQAPFEVAPSKQSADAAPSLATEDFLSVMSSSGEYLAMVEASRAWRQTELAYLLFLIRMSLKHPGTSDLKINLRGIPSVIVSRQSWEEANAEITVQPYETWVQQDSRRVLTTYPDLWTVDAAMAPLLAYDAHPDFKWMFWGDDDTVMFLHPAKEYLKALDPELPYYLVSDNSLWAHDMTAQHHGEPDTPAWATLPRHDQIPRCYPCRDSDSDQMLSDPHRQCPCTVQHLCNRLREVNALVSMEFCTRLRPFANRIYQHNGGGGAFLSVGFFRSLPGGVAAIKQCIIDRMVLRERAGVLHNLSGDTVFTGCTWQVAGLGPSTEALESPFLNWAGPNGLDESVWELPPDGHCDEACQWEAGHTISKHINSRAFPSLHLAAHHLRTLVQMHEAAM